VTTPPFGHPSTEGNAPRRGDLWSPYTFGHPSTEGTGSVSGGIALMLEEFAAGVFIAGALFLA
jgi:hypothetical protein